MGSFSYKYVMFAITNLIKPRMGKLILYHLIQNNCPDFRNGILDSFFLQPELFGKYFVFKFNS